MFVKIFGNVSLEFYIQKTPKKGNYTNVELLNEAAITQQLINVA
jgi:hypothetical protein